MKLHEVVAVEKGVKSRTYGQITLIDKQAQKAEPFSGISRNFRKKDTDGEDYPPERKKVTAVADVLLKQVAQFTAELFDVEATKDWGNCSAKADIVVDGQTLVSGAPVTFLLFLEKQVTDLRTMVDRFVTLDENEDWTLDANSGLYKTALTSTHRTQKVQKPLVLYPATPEHPAQTQIISEDVIVGWWDTTKFSGALPLPKKVAIVERLDKLLRAVKEARERANDIEIEKRSVGDQIFAYVFSS